VGEEPQDHLQAAAPGAQQRDDRAAGASSSTARTVARLSVAVNRGLLLDVLATGDDHEANAAMRYFSDMLFAHLASPDLHDSEPAT
jgi:hypothetical protein